MKNFSCKFSQNPNSKQKLIEHLRTSTETNLNEKNISDKMFYHILLKEIPPRGDFMNQDFRLVRKMLLVIHFLLRILGCLLFLAQKFSN